MTGSQSTGAHGGSFSGIVVGIDPSAAGLKALAALPPAVEPAFAAVRAAPYLVAAAPLARPEVPLR